MFKRNNWCDQYLSCAPGQRQDIVMFCDELFSCLMQWAWCHNNNDMRNFHDDIITWKHYSDYPLFLWGTHQLQLDSTHKGSVIQNFYGFFIISFTFFQQTFVINLKSDTIPLMWWNVLISAPEVLGLWKWPISTLQANQIWSMIELK